MRAEEEVIDHLLLDKENPEVVLDDIWTNAGEVVTGRGAAVYDFKSKSGDH